MGTPLHPGPGNEAPAVGSAPRVAMLTPDRDRVDRRILLQARSLQKGGCQVAVLALPSVHPDVDWPAGVELIRASDTAAPTAWAMSRLWRLYRGLAERVELASTLALARRGFETLLVAPDRAFTQTLRDPALAWAADVYVAHDLPVLPVSAEVAARRGVPLVYDAHELYPEQEFAVPLRRRWRAIEARHIHQAAAVLTVNVSIAAELATRYGIARPVVLSNALPETPPLSSTPRRLHEALGLDPRHRLVLYQGGLAPHRNLEGVIRGLARVRTPGVVAVFLGDGPLRSRLATLATRERTEGRVRFHPAVSQEALLEYTASADLGLVPYLDTSPNTRLATPNKLFEYIQAELPILASDLPELKRLVEGESLGLVRRLDTPDRMAAAIDEWFADPGRASSCRDALRRAKHRYAWEREEPKLLDVFRRLGVQLVLEQGSGGRHNITAAT